MPKALALDLVAIGAVGAFMALLSRWVDEEITAIPAVLDAAFHPVLAPAVQVMLDPRPRPDAAGAHAPPQLSGGGGAQPERHEQESHTHRQESAGPGSAHGPTGQRGQWRAESRWLPERAYGSAADVLPSRGALGSGLALLVEAGRILLAPNFLTHAVRVRDGRIELVSRSGDGTEQTLTADRIVAATGYRPDHAITSEVRLDCDAVLGAARALAPLIDPNAHSCGTVTAHGADELAHPEPGYYITGMKSYGRAPTFLMATGYEQVRSVVAALAGDWEATRDVRLELPETGVCSATTGSAALAQRLGLTAAQHDELLGRIARHLPAHHTAAGAVLAAAADLAIPGGIAMQLAAYAADTFGAPAGAGA
ncbi:hypothetical protein [Planomonospora sp. ID91781]|uniref:hypothetical protein n=1 Tax=Planomonospora sp. ID91781 TaxID=2738135 RepID=UPI0018C374A0|nr:hypothetical protein [Planomonospora sp. ID91781]